MQLCELSCIGARPDRTAYVDRLSDYSSGKELVGPEGVCAKLTGVKHRYDTMSLDRNQVKVGVHLVQEEGRAQFPFVTP